MARECIVNNSEESFELEYTDYFLKPEYLKKLKIIETGALDGEIIKPEVIEGTVEEK